VLFAERKQSILCMFVRVIDSKLSKYLYTIATYILTMATTTIQVSTELVNNLKTRRMYDKESYEDIIWDLLEDSMELSEETKRDIKQAEKEFKEGKTVTLAEVKKKLGL